MNRDNTHHRVRRRVLAAGAALGAVVGALVLAGPAAAHVTVDPETAPQGGYARVAFRVPNESDTASTTKLEVNLPAATPVASVRTKPVPGWQATLTRTKLPKPIDNHGQQITEAVTRITWTATTADAAIGPGEFEEFPVSMGPLPNADKIVFKALQTYSDGEVVSWIEEPSRGAEPEHPAPVLKLTKPTDGGDTAADNDAGDVGDSEDSARGSSTLPTVLAVAGLAAGLAALLLAGLAYARTRTGGPGSDE